jgi:hypothetical protein
MQSFTKTKQKFTLWMGYWGLFPISILSVIGFPNFMALPLSLLLYLIILDNCFWLIIIFLENVLISLFFSVNKLTTAP